MTLPEPTDVNLYSSPNDIINTLDCLPSNLSEAKAYAKESEIVRMALPQQIIDSLN